MNLIRSFTMKFAIQILFALVVVASLAGCSTSYMTNRRRDAADIVTIGVGVGFGAKTRVGPLQVGLLGEYDVVALRGGAAGFSPWLTGCADEQFIVAGKETFAPAPFGYPPSKAGYNVFDARGKSFKAVNYELPFWSTLAEDVSTPYYYTQIDLVAGLLLSARVGVNPGELVDFVLGWTTIDIFNDDIHVEGDYTYTVANRQAKIIDLNEACSGTLSITNTLGGYPVTSIGCSAFNRCKNLSGVMIPDGVTSVDHHAFRGCSKLTNVTIPASFTSIEADFACCSRLNSITVDELNPVCSSSADGVVFNKEKTQLILYPSGKAGEYAIPSSVTQIGSGAFNGSVGVTVVTIPDSVTNIGYKAFAYCSNLANIAIPSKLSGLGWSTFEGCTNLTSITIPGGIAKIEDYTFQGCSALSNVTLRNGVTSLGRAAFAGCSSLTEITIPASVTEISACTFTECPSLTRVLFKGNAPSGASDTSIFGDGSSNVTVYYLPGAKGWAKEFGGRPTAVWKK
jgi:hypothetical protein